VRVFLDTNVLISAFVSRGLCADLLKLVLERHELLVSDLVMQELSGVLIDKLQAPKALADRALSVLREAEVVPNPMHPGGELGLDADDNAIVRSAADARADVFVTGDRAILAAAGRMPVPVLSPRGFMALHRSPTGSYPQAEEGDDEWHVSETYSEPVHEAAFAFALSIVELCRALEAQGQTAVAAELLRAGAGVAAALEGMDRADPAPRATHPRARALQNVRATEYWLRLLEASAVTPDLDLHPYLEACRELIELLQVGFAGTPKQV
jgi:putative PIN family toxin of toxin-antitoxin system